MRNKYKIDDKTTFYVSDVGNGPVSGNLVWVTKFWNGFMQWNKGFKPEKITKDKLQNL